MLQVIQQSRIGGKQRGGQEVCVHHHFSECGKIHLLLFSRKQVSKEKNLWLRRSDMNSVKDAQLGGWGKGGKLKVKGHKSLILALLFLRTCQLGGVDGEDLEL